MDRFVAMIWDQEDQARLAQVDAWSETLQRQSPHWVKVLNAPGLRVFSYHHRGDAPIVTTWRGGEGIVIGVLFERGQEASGRVTTFDQHETARVASTRGDNLIKNYWGNYIALWRDADTQQTTVLRDPCGAVPCFLTACNGIDLLFAHAEDIADLPGLSFNIDWDYLRASILHKYFVTKYTGLKEVVELLGGERMEVRREGRKAFSFAWNAAEIAADPNRQGFDDAKAEMRATVESCFTAWGKEYRNIIIRMSGGLDSSIMAGMFRRVSDARLTGIHFVSVGYEQRELEKARLAADHIGIKLVELPLDPQTEDVRRIFGAPRMACPSGEIINNQAADLRVRLAESLGADCLMVGHGGDNLFLERGIADHVLSDYFHLNGFGRDFWRTAYDAAVLQCRSVWNTLHTALRAHVFAGAWDPYAFLKEEKFQKYCLLTPEAAASIPAAYTMHPWLARAARLPRGKADQLVNIVALNRYYSRCGDSLIRDDLIPYFSQPIVEFALRTPTYMFVRDGLDRALERSAFADLIPKEIAQRTLKGVYAMTYLEIKQKNIDFFRSTIFNSPLMKQGWLERAKIEHMLTPGQLLHGGGVYAIDDITTADAWLRSWGHDMAHAPA